MRPIDTVVAWSLCLCLALGSGFTGEYFAVAYMSDKQQTHTEQTDTLITILRYLIRRAVI